MGDRVLLDAGRRSCDLDFVRIRRSVVLVLTSIHVPRSYRFPVRMQRISRGFIR